MHRDPILLIDDEDTLGEAVAKMLRRKGFLVMETGDGGRVDLFRVNWREINVGSRPSNAPRATRVSM
jgi:hypothetical protein